MKKSTIILIITGVACTIVSVICLISATAMLANMGVNFASSAANAHDFKWSEGGNGNFYFVYPNDSDSSSSDNVEVHFPFMDVKVNGDKVSVKMPWIHVNVDSSGDNVQVEIGEFEIEPTGSTEESELTEKSEVSESTSSELAPLPSQN